MTAKKVMGFEIDEVCLRDAEALISIGWSAYADLIAALVPMLRQAETFNAGKPIEQQKAPRFRLPGGKPMDLKQAKKMCPALSKTLVKIGLAWVVRYSVKDKSFLCVPRPITAAIHPTHKKSPDIAERDAKIIELYKQGITGVKLAEKLAIPLSTVYNACSQYNLKKESK